MIKTIIKKYKWSIILLILLAILYFINSNLGENATIKTLSNFKSMLSVLPPILVLIGLLDVWVPKETMIKYMGHGSGIKGIFMSLLLGSLAAGPLYAAFPIAAILMKKEARFAYILFFLGVWSSSKLPLLLYEYTSFGGTFTTIHVISNLTIFLIGSFLIEKMIKKESLNKIYLSANSMIDD
ncbi:permease [Anaerovorax odorimutans]|uniref:permease n=1 Tax=Anaerovorax odorimutans TaxID=109327 RepID=UPI0003FE2D53|nr:permease [Anaerovorax odorimutans]